MAKLNDDSWLGYGKELTDALGEVLSFEKTHAREFQAMKDERDGLLAKSAALGEKIGAAEDDLAEMKRGLFADLDATAIKCKGKSDSVSKPSGKALAVAKQLRERGVELLRLKLDKLGIDQEAAVIAQRPYMARYELASRFFNALVGTAGIGIPGITRGCASFGDAGELTRQAKDLEERLAVVEGKAKTFQALGHSTGEINDILSFSESLPEKALPALVQAWAAALAEDAARIGMRFDANGLRWHITRRKPEAPKVFTSHDTAADVLGRAAV